MRPQIHGDLRPLSDNEDEDAGTKQLRTGAEPSAIWCVLWVAS